MKDSMDKENLKPKRRKSCRRFHDRRKNDVRKRQAKAREAFSVLQSTSARDDELVATTPTQQPPNSVSSPPESAATALTLRPPNSATALTQRQPKVTTTTRESAAATQPDSTLLQRHHPNLYFEDMRQQLHSAPLSAAWTPVYSASSIQLCMVKVAPMSQAKVERSITVNTDMSWHVHIAGKLYK